jgi:deoxyribose-phosphate aldolase
MVEKIASFIDHTLLKKEATKEEIEKLCLEAIKYEFKAVCVYPEHLFQIVFLLKNKVPIPITVVDFPLGEKSPEEKAKEAKKAFTMGAKEIDMVLNIKALKNKDYKLVFDGIRAVVDAVLIPVKVIIETGALNYDQKVIATSLACAAKAAFIKTSTGKISGATIEDVQLIRKIVDNDMKIKASGGIKTLEDVKKMIKAGANRIGSSSSVNIVTSC